MAKRTARPRKKSSKKKTSTRSSKTYIRLKPKVKKKLSRYRGFYKVLLIVFLGFLGWSIASKFFQPPFKDSSPPKVTKQAPRQSVVKTTLPKPPQEVVKKRRSPKQLSLHKPKLTIVLDDMGHTRQDETLLKTLHSDVTYAILPMLKHSTYFSLLSRQTGAEVILHQPLEAQDGTIPGPGLITSRMTEDHIKDILRRNLRSVPDHYGINNHMGSYGTTQKRVMGIILKELKSQNLFFLDSQTTGGTVSKQIGQELGLPVIRRDVFLDNVDEIGAIRTQLMRAASKAREQGYAIGIGHYRKNTLQVLNAEIPKLKQQGFEFASLYDLIAHLENN